MQKKIIFLAFVCDLRRNFRLSRNFPRYVESHVRNFTFIKHDLRHYTVRRHASRSQEIAGRAFGENRWIRAAHKELQVLTWLNVVKNRCHCRIVCGPLNSSSFQDRNFIVRIHLRRERKRQSFEYVRVMVEHSEKHTIIITRSNYINVRTNLRS